MKTAQIIAVLCGVVLGTVAGAAAFTSQVPIDASAPLKISGTVGTGNIAIRH